METTEILEGTGELQEVVIPDPAEEKAKAQGWVPKEQFRGDPEKWVDAKTFAERGEKIVPILKERNDHLEKEIREMKQTFQQFTDYHRQTEERVYNRAVKELESRRLQAVEDGDTDAFRQAEAERLELEKARPAVPVTPSEPPEFGAFKTKNSWYGTDPELTAEADALGRGYADGGMDYSKVLEKVENTIKKLYPEKFTNTRRDETASVSFAADTGLPQKSKARTYENLPADAKATCDKFVKQGLLTKEQYVKDYGWD